MNKHQQKHSLHTFGGGHLGLAALGYSMSGNSKRGEIRNHPQSNMSKKTAAIGVTSYI